VHGRAVGNQRRAAFEQRGNTVFGNERAQSRQPFFGFDRAFARQACELARVRREHQRLLRKFRQVFGQVKERARIGNHWQRRRGHHAAHDLAHCIGETEAGSDGERVAVVARIENRRDRRFGIVLVVCYDHLLDQMRAQGGGRRCRGGNGNIARAGTRGAECAQDRRAGKLFRARDDQRRTRAAFLRFARACGSQRVEGVGGQHV
jgi:hypothetical protein